MPAPPLQDGRPTLTVSQRRQYFEDCRFLEVRHLAYLHYKKPDGEPLLKYEDTLDNREMVKQNVLAFEVAAGWLIPDGTEGQIQIPAQPQPQPVAQPAVQQGAQPMQPFNPPPPPNGAPQMQQAPIPQQPQYAVPAPQQQQMAPPPQMQQAPQMAPPQPQYAAPAPQQMMQPPPASPQQAAAVGAPAQQEAPAAAPTGRRRKGQGTNVAPPPPAPPPQPQGQVPVQQFAPPQQQQMQFPPPGAPIPQMQAPAPFGAPTPQPQFAPQQPPAFQPQATQGAPAPQQAAAVVDLGPVIGRVDALAKMVEGQAQQIKELKNTAEMAVGILHHLYLVNQQLQPQAGQPALPNTLPEFKKYFQQFIGNPP